MPEWEYIPAVRFSSILPSSEKMGPFISRCLEQVAELLLYSASACVTLAEAVMVSSLNSLQVLMLFLAMSQASSLVTLPLMLMFLAKMRSWGMDSAPE